MYILPLLTFESTANIYQHLGLWVGLLLGSQFHTARLVLPVDKVDNVA